MFDGNGTISTSAASLHLCNDTFWYPPHMWECVKVQRYMQWHILVSSCVWMRKCKLWHSTDCGDTSVSLPSFVDHMGEPLYNIRILIFPKERILYWVRHRHRQTALKDTQLKEFQLSDNPAVASLSDSVDLHCCSWPHRMPCAWRVLTGSLWEK